MTHRGVIFDLDGTLLDTLADLAGAMNSALAANSLPPHPDPADHKYFIGDGVANYVLRATPADVHGDLNVRSHCLADGADDADTTGNALRGNDLDAVEGIDFEAAVALGSDTLCLLGVPRSLLVVPALRAMC